MKRIINCDFITRKYLDEIHTQLSADMCKHHMLVLQFNSEHGIRELLNNNSLNLDHV